MTARNDPLRVLQVDDEQDLGATAASAVEETFPHFSVEIAMNVADGLEKLESGSFDCIVSDYEMPEQNGLEFLTAVREQDPEIPFILYTGTASRRLAQEALTAGATDYLPKSIDTDSYDLLARRIESVVAKQRDGTLSHGVDESPEPKTDHDRWLMLFENLGEPVVEVVFEGDDARISRVNEAFESVFGYEESEIVGEYLDPLIVPENRRDEARSLNRDTRKGNVSEQELIRKTVDGPRSFLLRTVPFSVDGTDHGYAIYLDIAERTAHRQKLTALHDVADEITRCDNAEAVCDRAIEASEDILEFDLSIIDLVNGDTLEPQTISADIPPGDITPMATDEGIAGRTFTDQRSFLLDNLLDHEDSEPQGPYRSAISVPIGEHGIFQAVSEEAGVFDDTDLELAQLLVSHVESALDRLERERRLERQNDRLNEYTSVVSHDLRNPLNVAQGRLELARDDHEDEHLERAAEAIDRSLALIDDLLTYAREGEAAKDLETIQLDETVQQCWAIVDTGEASLEVETDATIWGDPQRVRQLLENLIRNAVKHGGEGITVTIGTLENGFYVADDGHGIPEDDREHLFEAGYSTAEEGSGLGLSIVREIVEAHDWTITATESESGGARFEIRGVRTV